MELLNPLIATLIVSLISLIGIFSIFFKKDNINKFLFFLVAFSAGSMLSGAFLHLLPESIENIGAELSLKYAFIGFIIFFVIEKLLHWRHCHECEGECVTHTFTYMNLLGDGVHNFLDGVLIGASFAISNSVGITTTFLVIAHEIPQEIGDFGVLLYGGFSKFKALLFNFLSGIMAVLGVFAFVFFSDKIGHLESFFLPFAAGGFLYISSADLLPELHKHNTALKSILSFVAFGLGIIVLYFIESFIG